MDIDIANGLLPLSRASLLRAALAALARTQRLNLAPLCRWICLCHTASARLRLCSTHYSRRGTRCAAPALLHCLTRRGTLAAPALKHLRTFCACALRTRRAARASLRLLARHGACCLPERQEEEIWRRYLSTAPIAYHMAAKRLISLFALPRASRGGAQQRRAWQQDIARGMASHVTNNSENSMCAKEQAYIIALKPRAHKQKRGTAQQIS